MAVTLAQLTANAQVKSDLRGSLFLTAAPTANAEWTVLINDAIKRLWREVIGINPDFRVKNTPVIITSTSSPSATLPTDFFDARAVVKDMGLASEEVLGTKPYRTARRTIERSYRIDDVNIVIEPYTLSVGNYTLRYNPDPTALAAVGDLMDAELARFSEYVEWLAARAARVIDESPTDSIDEAIKVGYAEVKSWAAGKRQADPPTVEDVRPRRNRGWPYRWPT
jgi:hypothetical protein